MFIHAAAYDEGFPRNSNTRNLWHSELREEVVGESFDWYAFQINSLKCSF